MLIAGPNLAIDRTHELDELRPGEVLRSRAVAVTPGGKGVNVARAARALDVSATLVGFLAGHTGDAAGALLAEEGLDVRSVAIDGELRSTQVLMEDGGRVTVLNEPGPAVGSAEWSAFVRTVEAALGEHRALVCAGSAPPGAPADAYGRLAALARARGLACVVDATGETLAAALDAGPDVVTPNLGEAEGLLAGRSAEDVKAAADARPRALAAAEALLERGARAAIVTAAAAGAAVAEGVSGAGPAAEDRAAVWLPAPRVEVRNPIGAGDAFVAALAAGLERGEPLLDCARAAVAAGAASVERELAGDLDPARAAELLSDDRLRRA